MNIKYITASLLAATFSLSIMAVRIPVQTNGMSLILDVENGQSAKYLYFGDRINNNDISVMTIPSNGRMDIYPAYGMNTPYEPV